MLTGDMLRYNALKYPDKEALVHEDAGRRTYAELDQRANRVAAMLRRLGVRQGDRVNLLSRNALECVETFFACAKAGFVYSPLNYRFAVPEVEYVINDAGAEVVLVSNEYSPMVVDLRPKLPNVRHVVGFGPDHGCELDYETLVMAESGEYVEPERPIDEDDVCWICYTGGTTGMSKGVMLTHRNNFVQCVNESIADRIKHEDTYLITGALFHVVLNMGLPYWWVGAKVVTINFEVDKCLDLMEREGVTKTVPVATMLNLLIDGQRRRPRDLKVELMGLGGAPISPDIVREAGEVFGCDFVQYFGQTEAAHHFTYLSADDYRRGLAAGADETLLRRLRSGGRAQHCCLTRVVDDDDNTVPPGQVGEICGFGLNVMKGYWNKPDLTAETLKGGWLHTGDMGYMDEDGYVYVVDRKKDMIVSGGENVYSTEVERALYQHPAILECAVIGIPDQQWGEAVTAYVVAKPGAEVVADEVIAFTKERIAHYKAPKHVIQVESLPKSATGKIQKAELRKAAWAGADRLVGASVKLATTAKESS